MHSTDGNLAALAKYQAEVDAADERQMALEAYLEEHPDATEDQAWDALESAKQDYYDSRAEAMMFDRAEREYYSYGY